MARDHHLYRRLYGHDPPSRPGAPPRPVRTTSRWGWALLVALVLVPAAVRLWPLVEARGAPGEPELRAWGVLDPDEALTAEYGAPPFAKGCALTGRGRVVRWKDQRPDGSIAVDGAVVTTSDAGVWLTRGDQRLDCRFGDPDQAFRFGSVLERARR
jgi:hypothetical protein